MSNGRAAAAALKLSWRVGLNKKSARRVLVLSYSARGAYFHPELADSRSCCLMRPSIYAASAFFVIVCHIINTGVENEVH